ncbi:MAG: Holliday junction branch migration protein RuvA [Thiotrichales bacterium]
MIARLRGELIEKRPPWVMLEVGGVGYEVEVPMSTLFALPEIGHAVTLLTHLQVREDAHVLFGFLTEPERVLFRQLLKVTGIGARMALAILSGMSPEEFRRCVLRGEVQTLVRLPGIGKKTAERLVVEMRDRLEKGPLPAAGASATFAAPQPDPAGDAIEALIALGYKPPEATRMVNALATDGLGSEAIIRLALKSTLK